MKLHECKELLIHYEQVVLTLHECHKKNAYKYQQLSNVLLILNIILGTITGTSSISIYNSNNANLQLINIIIIYIMTFLSSIQKIIEPSTQYERFRNASEEYLSLFYEIKYQKTFELKTEQYLKQYVKDLNLKLEDLRVKFPFILDTTYDMVKQKVLTKSINIPCLSLETIEIKNNIKE